MADTLVVLAQNSPAAATAATLYTATSNGAVVSSIFVCNTNTTSITFRIWVRALGGSVGTDVVTTLQALYYEMTLASKDTFVATVGITLAATENIRVQASATAVVFTAFGVAT